VTVTATSVADSTQSGSATIIIPSAPAVSAGSLPSGSVGTTYAATLTASGGLGPYTWSLANGALPAGLTLDRTGAISGTPLAAAAGTTQISVEITDSGTPNALSSTQVVSLTVQPAPAIHFGSPTALTDAGLSSAYAASIAAAGGVGPLTYSVVGGTLPPGLTMAANGAIAGTPTEAGGYTFNAKASDAFGDSSIQPFTLRVNFPALTITVPNLPALTIGTSLTPATFTASGGSGTGYIWSVSKGSALPAGVTFSPSGVLSGKPDAVATTAFSVTVTDSAGNTAFALASLVVKSVLTISTPLALPNGDAQALYAVLLQVTGGAGSPYLWSLVNGSSLPAGITLQNNGLLRGTPTVSGTFTFALRVTDLAGNTGGGTFSLTIGSGVMITTGTTLKVTWVGGGFDQLLTAAGGTGTGYKWTVTSGSTLPPGILLAPAGQLNGTPSTAGNYTFSLTVKDSGGNSTNATFALTVNSTVAITSPTTLPDGSVGTSYSETLTASGGTGAGYIWVVQSGSSALTALGLTVSPGGVVSGIPTQAGTAVFHVWVTDPSLTYANADVSVTVDGVGGRVSGSVSLANGCGDASIPPITVSINTNPAQTTTTDAGGNYSFAFVPNGTYTITPSIAGPSAAFYPASLAGVVVNNAAITVQNFSVAPAYNVSGNVSYAGPETGPMYISLIPSCGNASPVGTSIPGPGNFTIRGVPPGTYRAQAWIDSQGFGYPNVADASGSATGVTVAGADLTSVSISLTDAAAATLTNGPTLNVISATDQGVLINFAAITGPNSSGQSVELPASYEVQWSTDPAFQSGISSHSFQAGGANSTGVWLLNNSLSGLAATFTNGATCYFRARGVSASVTSDWAYFGNIDSPTGVTIGAPSGGNTITGTVTFSAVPTGPLYVGFFNKSTGQAYTAWFANPGATQPYSLQVPSGNYLFFAVLDQNKDGMIDPGDLSNIRSQADVSVSSDSTQNVNLADLHSETYVTTQYWSQTVFAGSSPATSSGYGLSFNLAAGDRLPVAVTLTSGPHVPSPIDFAKCNSCGNVQFQYNQPINSSVPQVGDTYTFQVSYSDGSSDQLAGAVTAVRNDLPTKLSPAGSTSSGATPTFTWTPPANAASYTYSFTLRDNDGNAIWEIPGKNSNSIGFDSSVTSIPWNTDPTGSGSLPIVPSLTTGATYTWQIQLQDQNGNSAQAQTTFIP
jgi:hypothetical protein